MQPYYHDLLCGNFFEMTLHDGIQQLDQGSVDNFRKKTFFRKVTHTQFGPKLCNLLFHDLLFEDFRNVVA